MIRTGVSYYGTRALNHVESDLDEMKKNNVTYVVHTFSENDYMFYRETMKDIAELTKKKGLEAQFDPWGLVGIFGGEAFSDFVSFNTDVRQVLNNNQTGAAACPNHPDTLKFLKRWIDAAIDASADAIFWDEPHFYYPGRFGRKEPKTVWGCLCKHCQRRFRKMFRKSMPTYKTDKVVEFQDKCLVELLDKLVQYTFRKECQSTLCLLPHRSALERGLWDVAAQIPNLVSIGTDPYWSDLNRQKTHEFFDRFFTAAARKIVSLSKRYHIGGHLWIQNFNIKRNREEDISDAIWRAYDTGIRDFAAWTFFGNNYMSSLKTDDPKRVWQILGKSYWRLHHIKST